MVPRGWGRFYSGPYSEVISVASGHKLDTFSAAYLLAHIYYMGHYISKCHFEALLKRRHIDASHMVCTILIHANRQVGNGN